METALYFTYHSEDFVGFMEMLRKTNLKKEYFENYDLIGVIFNIYEGKLMALKHSEKEIDNIEIAAFEDISNSINDKGNMHFKSSWYQVDITTDYDGFVEITRNILPIEKYEKDRVVRIKQVYDETGVILSLSMDSFDTSIKIERCLNGITSEVSVLKREDFVNGHPSPVTYGYILNNTLIDKYSEYGDLNRLISPPFGYLDSTVFLILARKKIDFSQEDKIEKIKQTVDKYITDNLQLTDKNGEQKWPEEINHSQQYIDFFVKNNIIIEENGSYKRNDQVLDNVLSAQISYIDHKKFQRERREHTDEMMHYIMDEPSQFNPVESFGYSEELAAIMHGQRIDVDLLGNSTGSEYNQLLEMYASKAIDQMAQDVDVLGENQQSQDPGNKQLGFAMPWVLGLLTGAVSVGLLLLGVFLSK